MARPPYGISFLNFTDLTSNDAIGIAVLHRGVTRLCVCYAKYFISVSEILELLRVKM